MHGTIHLLLGLVVQGEVLMLGVYVDRDSGCSYIALAGQESVLFHVRRQKWNSLPLQAVRKADSAALHAADSKSRKIVV